MPYVAELLCYDPVAGVETSRRFAFGQGLPLPDTGYIPPGLISWQSPTQKLTLSDSGPLQASTDVGAIQINNAPAVTAGAGPNDQMVRLVFQGRRATLYQIAATWADRQVLASGIVQQPKAIVSVGGQAAGIISLAIRDPRSVLTGALQPTKFAGTNADGDGVEGTPSDLQGKPKPILYGRASNIPGVAVNTSQLIYQVADVPVVVDCVRDGGNAIQPQTQRASLASLYAGFPDGGYYDYYAGAEGTFVKVATKPKFVLTFDVYEGASISDRTHAQIWARLRQRCGTAADHLDGMAAMDALDAGEAGFWWSDEITQLDALNEVLTSASAFEKSDDDGFWTVEKLVVPAGPPAIQLKVLTPQSILGELDRKLRTLAFVQPDYQPDGSLICRVTLSWGRAYQVMGDADFAGVTAQRLKDKFKQEWRTATATDTTIWDPDAMTGPWINAPVLAFTTGYASGPDGISSPAAQSEANRLLALYGAWRSAWQVDYEPQAGDRVSIGDVVQMAVGAYGLEAGALFRVLQAGIKLDANGLSGTLVFGLQG